MENIVINRKQAQAIAKAMVGDIKQHTIANADRYVPWVINEIRKRKGKPPFKPITIELNHPPCVYCRNGGWE